jgi:H+/Cl- antiporter ClcA
MLFEAWWGQILAGAAVVLVLSWFGAPTVLQRVQKDSKSWSPVSFAILTFLAGAVAGCVLNLALAYDAVHRGSTTSYLLKPLFWLAAIGVPWAAFVGLILGRMLQKIAWRSAV